jgi:exodeoxyribonuclease VII large subunit
VRATLDGHLQRIDWLSLQLARPAQALGRHGHGLTTLEQRLRTAALIALQRQERELERAARRLQQSVGTAVRAAHARVDALQARTHALDPKRVLARGYAWLSDENDRPLTSASQVQVGQALRAQWSDGVAEARVTTVTLSDPKPA